MKVWTRRYKGLRSVLAGYLVAFDKHMNLVSVTLQQKTLVLTFEVPVFQFFSLKSAKQATYVKTLAKFHAKVWLFGGAVLYHHQEPSCHRIVFVILFVLVQNNVTFSESEKVTRKSMASGQCHICLQK